MSYTMSAVAELGRHGVAVNIDYPPLTDTGWVNDAVRELDNQKQLGDWSYGYHKGRCWPGQGIIGVSRSVTGIELAQLLVEPSVVAPEGEVKSPRRAPRAALSAARPGRAAL